MTGASTSLAPRNRQREVLLRRRRDPGDRLLVELFVVEVAHGAPLASSCAAARARTSVAREIRGSSGTHPDRSARGPEDEVLAAVVDARRRVPRDQARRRHRGTRSRESCSPGTFCCRAATTAASAQSPRSAATTMAPRSIPARAASLQRAGIDRDHSSSTVAPGKCAVDALSERSGKAAVLRPDPRHTRCGRPGVGRRIPSHDARELRSLLVAENEPDEVADAVALRARADEREVRRRMGARSPRDCGEACRLVRDEDEREVCDACKRSVHGGHAGQMELERADEPDAELTRRRRHAARRRCRGRARLVRPAAPRCEQRESEAQCRCQPHRPYGTAGGYGTVVGMPGILPAFRSANWPATALRTAPPTAGAPAAHRDAPVLGPEDHVGAAVQLPRPRASHRGRDGHVGPLEHAGQDGRAERGLVGTEADPGDALRPRRGECPGTAGPGDLELDDGSLCDLLQRLLLAFGRHREIAGVGAQNGEARVRPLGPEPEPGERTIDRRDVEAADRADRLAAAPRRPQPGGVARPGSRPPAA